MGERTSDPERRIAGSRADSRPPALDLRRWPVASGKLTSGRLVAERIGVPLFHNHLVVDAVAAVFPFGSPEFVRLREQFWLETISAAASAGQSLIFTFAPEPSVAADFPDRVEQLIARHGGQITYIALDLDEAEQERRLVDASRQRFGKLRSPEILRTLRPRWRLA